MIIDNFVSHTSPLPAARCWRGRTHSSQSVIRSVHPTLPCILGRAINETSRKFSLFSKKASTWARCDPWHRSGSSTASLCWWWCLCEGWGKVKPGDLSSEHWTWRGAALQRCTVCTPASYWAHTGRGKMGSRNYRRIVYLIQANLYTTELCVRLYIL